MPRGATGANGWIEFVNRIFTGLVSVAVALAVLGSRRRVPRRPDLTRWSWGLVAGVLAQALLGGLVVVLARHPVAVAGHYLLSVVLVANAVVLHHRAGEPDGPAARPRPRRSCCSGRAALVGAGRRSCWSPARSSPAAGPTAATTAADRLPFAVTTVARIHSVDRVGVPRRRGRSCCAGWRGATPTPRSVGRGRLLVGAIVAQGALGYVQYFAGVPELLVGAHVLGSVLVWVAVLPLPPRPHRARSPPPSAPRRRADRAGRRARRPS